MEIENINLGFRDFIAYLVPGFIMLLWLFLVGILDSIKEEIYTLNSIVLIVCIVLGSYVLGHVISPARVFLIELLRLIFGDPRIELIKEKPFRSKFKLFLFRFFLIEMGEFDTDFRSKLLKELRNYWSTSLVKGNPLAVYVISSKFVRHNSPNNAYQIDRYLSLRNMHGAMVLPFILFLIWSLTRSFSCWFCGFLFISNLLFVRNCYVNLIDEAKDVYRTFYMLRHNEISKKYLK